MPVPKCHVVATGERLALAMRFELPHATEFEPRPCQYAIGPATSGKLVCEQLCKFELEGEEAPLALPPGSSK